MRLYFVLWLNIYQIFNNILKVNKTFHNHRQIIDTGKEKKRKFEENRECDQNSEMEKKENCNSFSFSTDLHCLKAVE